MLGNIVIPLHPEYIAAAGAAGSALSSAADKVVFTVPFKCEVVRVGVAVTTTCDGTGVVSFDKRPTAGSDSSRGDGDVGVIRLLTTAAGKTLYADPTDRIELVPGDEVVVQVSTATTSAGTGRPFLLVKPVAEMPGNLTDMVAST